MFFHSYQVFVQNFINIHTPYTRLLLKHSTGSGKTLSAIGIAMQFIEYFKKEEHQFVTVEEFCKYTGIKEEQVKPLMAG